MPVVAGGSTKPSDNLVIGTDIADKTFRVESSAISVDLDPLSGSFVDVFSETGFGYLYGYTFVLNNTAINVRLEVDSEEIFNISVGDLTSGGSTPTCYAGAIWYDHSSSKIFSFKLDRPMQYDTSFKLQAKASTENSSRKVLSNYVSLLRIA